MLGDLVIEMVFQLRLMDCYGCLVARSTVVPGTDGPVGVGTGRCASCSRCCCGSGGAVPGWLTWPRWAGAFLLGARLWVLRHVAGRLCVGPPAGPGRPLGGGRIGLGA